MGHNRGKAILGAFIGGGVVLSQLACPAHASFHLWQIAQVYSDASGNVQFIELQQPSFMADDERFLTFASLSDDVNGNSYSFHTNLPAAPAPNQYFLVATPGYAALPGVPTPDYTLPFNHWFDPTGDTIFYAGGLNTFTFAAGELPTDGVNALFRQWGATTITTGTNFPTNFAGQSGTVSIPNPGALWNGGNGNWSNVQKWSTNPAYPNNGTPVGKVYDVTINTGIVTLDVDVKVNSVTVANPGTLDLASHSAAIEAANSTDKAGKLAQIQAAITNASITSSATSADSTHKITVVVDNAVLGLTSLAGLSVDANSLLIESTWLGDSNLDRKVDVTDLGILATNYGQTVANGILQGDFNGNGKVDVTDLGLLATNYGAGTTGQPFAINASSAAVPEPASLGLLAMAGAAMFSRRRKNAQ